MSELTTKEKLIHAALTLFSEKGYDATSVDEIAESIGMTGPVIYKHFKGKEDLLKCVFDISENLFFNKADYADQLPIHIHNTDELKKFTWDQLDYTMNDEMAVKKRKLCTIEQFRIDGLAREATDHQYEDVVNLYTGIFVYMMKEGTMKEGDPVILAFEFSAPIARLIQLIDMDSNRKDEAVDLIQKHMDFFFSHGSLYKVMNGNLMFHGGLPMDEEGNFRDVTLWGKTLKGRAYMDWVDHLCRVCYRRRKLEDQDFFWFMWIHPDSPVTGRTIKTFERSYIDDESTWPEPQDPYYKLHRKKEICEKVLHEFGLDSPQSHIINGHTPVKVAKGDTPVRAGGKEICIDGGFCKAYQKSTGIAGYTLIFNSHGIRIKAHYTFQDIEHVLTTNADIDSVTTQVEMEPKRVMIGDTDNGQNLKQQISDLTDLLKAYRDGKIMEKR